MKQKGKRKDILNESNNDLTYYSAAGLHLKYNDPEGDNTIRFQYSKYDDDYENKIDKEFIFEDRKGGLFWKQANLMIWKNYLVFYRSLKSTIFQILTPVFMCMILIFLQALLDSFSDGMILKNPEIISLPKIDKCRIPEDCITLGYGIIVFIF